MARAALVLVTAIWGSTFVVVHSGLDHVSPFLLLGSRGLIAALVLAASSSRARRELVGALRLTLPMSLSLFIGMALQTHGLRWTTPSRSAFVTALSVVIVPLLFVVLRRTWPLRRLWIAAAIAVAGVYVLFRPLHLQWGLGDSLTLVGAFAFAYYVIELGRRAGRVRTSTLALVQATTLAVYGLALAVVAEAPRLEIAWAPVLALLYLGVVCTAGTFFLMSWGQAQVSPIEAAVIYALEPVMAAAFSITTGSEPFRWALVLGGGLICFALSVARGPRTK